ncbi:tyrosine protein phosphatase [candidate division KSB1 bacterium]|nr:tyrosine protein phosphatase [candidate division KSB1 bacterium]
MQFIDTHSHVLAYCDDGAPNWEISLEMLRDAENDGIAELVCTPHILSRGELENETELWSLYKELLKLAENAQIAIKIHMGSELYVYPELKIEKRISTLAQNGKYFLAEFPMALIPEFVPQLFFDLLMEGKTPVIAHPERNGGFIENPKKAYEFVERGSLLQLTAGSLLGIFGRTIQTVAEQLIDANLVHIIATDAHNLSSRPLRLKEAFLYVQEKWGDERARALCYENPKKLIQGQQINIGEPVSINFSNKKSLTGKIKSLFLR